MRQAILRQCLSGLNALHERDLVHKGITSLTCMYNKYIDYVLGIGLSTIKLLHSGEVTTPVVKLDRAFWFVTLYDMYRSNPFGDPCQMESPLPNSW